MIPTWRTSASGPLRRALLHELTQLLENIAFNTSLTAGR